ncbi:MAG: hypothetical protein IKD89_08070 [Clostridia bacterium]|nr:hypothetical protein [Clostridia bacterium]
MEDKISKLSELLSSPDGASRIKELLSSFAGEDENEDAARPEDRAPAASAARIGQNAQNVELMTKMGEVMSAMNDTSDSRIALLSSLRPFMHSRRASRIDEAMRILQITKLSRLINKPKKEA